MWRLETSPTNEATSCRYRSQARRLARDRLAGSRRDGSAFRRTAVPIVVSASRTKQTSRRSNPMRNRPFQSLSAQLLRLCSRRSQCRFDFNGDDVDVAGKNLPRMLCVLHPDHLSWIRIENRVAAVGEREVHARSAEAD